MLALTSDGRLHPLTDELLGASVPKSVRMPDGTQVRVARPIKGGVTETTWMRSEVGVATLPPGTNLRDYDVVTLHADRGFGRSEISLADAAMLNPSGQILATTLPAAGSSLSVRASSCLQWPGFTDRRVYVLQTGGGLATHLELARLR